MCRPLRRPSDGLADIIFAALPNQTFPGFQNTGKGEFNEVTTPSGMRNLSRMLSGFGVGLYDFDDDGWKDVFVSGGHVEAHDTPGQPVDRYNTVFRNLGSSGKWKGLTEAAGFDASPKTRHRSCAFADLDGNGGIDAVVSGIGRKAEVWMNRSPSPRHWLDVSLRGTKSNRDGIGARISVVSKAIGRQYNHMTTSVGYASSSYGPVHFGRGPDSVAELVEIRLAIRNRPNP